MFESVGEINRQWILDRVSEEDIYHKYLGIYPNTEDYYTNPLRNDDNADCRFYRDNTVNKSLKFKDFAWGVNWDCFNAVQYVCADVNNFYDALRRVAKDFNLYGEEINYDLIEGFSERVETSRRNTSIRVKRRDWYNFDMEWWKNNCTGDLKILQAFNVAPLDAVWIGEKQVYWFSKNDPAYVFWFGEHNYKIYYPLRKNGRFMNNRTTLLQGYLQLPKEGDNLIITKSYKDVICMRTFGIYAVAPMSETVMVTEEQYSDLADRFFNIYSLMDRDRTGMKMSIQLKEAYGIEPLLFPTDNKLFRDRTEPKDFTDHYFQYGLQYMLELIEEVKKWAEPEQEPE
jgi:hypothetical protein